MYMNYIQNETYLFFHTKYMKPVRRPERDCRYLYTQKKFQVLYVGNEDKIILYV